MQIAESPCASTTLRKASRAVARIFDEAISPTGITTAQLSILRAVRRAGPDGQPLSRLAETMVMDRTSLYRAIAPLERAGWIEVHNASSGRSKLARLTENGAETLDEANIFWDAAQSDLIQAFGASRWDALRQELLALTAVSVGLRTSPNI